MAGTTQEPTIEQAARLLMVHSPYAASMLSKHTPGGPIYQQVYDRVAARVLSDPESGLSLEERSFIAAFISLDTANTARSFLLRVRLTDAERDALQRMAKAADMDMSEYVRARLFG